MNPQHPHSPDDTYPVPLLDNRDLDEYLTLVGENLPRDTMPCLAPPPPSSLAPMSIDLTADYLDEP